ncbi:MAG TPA: Gfo/Idh/MocA family oxidoreductase [Opitutaceae bacterium]|jgi:predicted dehydrogenase
MTLSRRQFLKATGLAAAAAVCPTLRAAESDRFRNLVPSGRRMRIAGVGAGGKAFYDLLGCSSEDIVALCDPDFARGLEGFGRFPAAARYRDYRQMLNEQADAIDAVIVTTPDHTHFPAALMAVEMGKHVYVQKPLCHTVAEVRALKAAVAKAGVVSQMGNQGHCNEGTRLTKEWIEAGAIGQVREVHTWTDRPIWPQGMTPPAAVPPPATLDWNLWLGIAPQGVYNPLIAPFNWRGYWNYGCGALGDMGCHGMDAAFWALDLRGPVRVSAKSEGASDVVGPTWSVISFEFPQRGSMGPVTYTWYDGGKKPPVPEELGAGAKLPPGGTYYRGDGGVLYAPGDLGESPRLVPESRMASFKRPPKTLRRIPGGNPYLDWITGCKGGPAPASNIVDHSADLSQMVLLGNVAIRAGVPIDFDPQTGQCQQPEGNRYLSETYRLF